MMMINTTIKYIKKWKSTGSYDIPIQFTYE